MSDNETLVERLHQFNEDADGCASICDEAAARIAELEARLALERGSYAGVQRNLEARIAELEADVISARGQAERLNDPHMETTAEERARWAPAVGRAWDMSINDAYRLLRDLDRALADIARTPGLYDYITELKDEVDRLNERIAELEAERDASKAAIASADAIVYAAVLAEREACAAEAERFWECVTPDDTRHLQKRIAQAIRARPAS